MRSLAFVTIRRLFRLRVGADELLSRFLFSSSDYAIGERRVKPRAFLPPKDGKTSCFRVDGLTQAHIERLGKDKVAAARGKPLRGWATLKASIIASQGLSFDPDDTPPRHVNLASWPVDKDEQLEIAQELAAASKLRLADESPPTEA